MKLFEQIAKKFMEDIFMAKITLVGCGMMGSALVSAIMNNKHEVIVVDKNENSVKPFVKKGAIYFSNLSDALDSDVILINLPSANIVLNVIQNCPEDKLKGCNIVDTTTTTPEDAVQIYNLTNRIGVNYLTGRIECHPSEIGSQLAFVVYSGNKTVFDSNIELLKAWSAEPLYLGENIGISSVFDLGLVLNFTFAGIISLLEGAALSKKYGFPIDDFVNYAEMLMPAFINVMKREIDLIKGFTGSYQDAKEAKIETYLRTVKMVEKSLKAGGLKPILAEPIREILEKSVDQGYGNKELSAVIALILNT